MRHRLSRFVHESLAQRVVVRLHRGDLTRDERSACAGHRLKVAGTNLPMFEPAAPQALLQATQGLPRKVNCVAPPSALSAAALARAKQITAEHVRYALAELH